MIELITHYIRNIALLLIFIALTGIVLPSSKYKNYIDMVLGLLLIIMVIKPVAEIVSGKDSFDAYEYIAVFENDGEMNSSIDTNIQNKLVEKNFTDAIEKQVSGLIEPKGYIVSQIDLTFDSSTGEIESMNLTVNKRAEDDSSNKKTPLIEIEPVVIRLPGFTEKTQETPEIKNIKKVISDFYNLTADNIHIIVQNK